MRTGWYSRRSISEGSRVRRGSCHSRRDGNFPSDMSLGSPEGLEEERRLFYVAITRARRNLAVYVPLRYHHNRVRDDHSWAQPSRFLSESVRSTLVEVPTRHQPANPMSQLTVVIHGSRVVEDICQVVVIRGRRRPLRHLNRTSRV